MSGRCPTAIFLRSLLFFFFSSFHGGFIAGYIAIRTQIEIGTLWKIAALLNSEVVSLIGAFQECMTETRVVRAAHGRTAAQSRSRRTLSVSSTDWSMYLFALAEQSGEPVAGAGGV